MKYIHIWRAAIRMVIEDMGQIATVTSKSMVTIPSKIRRKYSLRQGSKVEFVEVDGGLFLVPVKTLRELRGAGKENAGALISGIKELEREHREEARSSA
jgi:AbrB family looped-hinge helix DNA binding protein